MEDILRKNIFDDKVLCKLSPDFTPMDIFLRMQLRRSMVKDTHNHGLHKSSNWQRKSPKKAKDTFRINKELVKIKNDFQMLDLKNHILLKHALKKEEKRDSKIINNVLDDNIKSSYNENIAALFIEENNFEIKSKPILAKIRESVNNTQETNKETKDDKELNKEHILRIECKHACSSSLPLTIVPNDKDNKKNIKGDTLNVKDNLFLWNNFDEQATELQKLLVMMAISHQTSEAENAENEMIENFDVTSSEATNIASNETLTVVSNSVAQSIIIDLLSVTPLKIAINKRQRYILNKYIRIWRNYVSKKKESRSKERQKTLNNFFNNLEKKKQNGNATPEANKAKLLVRDYKTYQHRYKVQKHIIAFQKAKLEEQSRLIEELKYNKIVEGSRQSVDNMKEEIRKTYFEIDRQLKPKVKLLSNELKIHEIEETSLVLHCLKVPQFLQRMEKRAREREEKHAMIRERRKQMEEERIRHKEQAELAKSEMDKEEKLKRMKELKERRKREKIENIRKKQYAEKMRALIVIADLHYEKNLMVKYGIRPLRRLLDIKKENIERARAHYKFQLQKNIFLNWMWYTEDMWYERNYKAEDFYRKKMLRTVLNAFRQNHYEYILKKQVAEDYYDLYVTNLVFRQFRVALELVRRENGIKWQKAVAYFNRTLPALNALKREQEARKAKWREKVLQVVPDYKPPED